MLFFRMLEPELQNVDWFVNNVFNVDEKIITGIQLWHAETLNFKGKKHVGVIQGETH